MTQPKTQSDAALQPPGRVPPVATGTATSPSSGPRWEQEPARPKRIKGWVLFLMQLPLLVISAVLAVASPNDSTRVIGFLGYTLSLFLVGFFMGKGMYRDDSEQMRTVRSPQR